jgi:hypothetical protein
VVSTCVLSAGNVPPKARVCGNCHQTGHKIDTCPQAGAVPPKAVCGTVAKGAGYTALTPLPNEAVSLLRANTAWIPMIGRSIDHSVVAANGTIPDDTDDYPSKYSGKDDKKETSLVEG